MTGIQTRRAAGVAGACALAAVALIGGPLTTSADAASGKTYRGTEAADSFVGTQGDDLANLLGGSDRFRGRGGADRVRGGDDADTIYGGNGPDRIWGEGGADMLAAGRGDDRVSAGQGATAFGGPGDDRIDVCIEAGLCGPGGSGTSTVLAGPGDDVVTVSPVAPIRADGGPGTDRLILLIDPAALAGGVDDLDVNLDAASGSASFGDGSPFTGFEQLSVRIDLALS